MTQEWISVNGDIYEKTLDPKTVLVNPNNGKKPYLLPIKYLTPQPPKEEG